MAFDAGSRRRSLRTTEWKGLQAQMTRCLQRLPSCSLHQHRRQATPRRKASRCSSRKLYSRSRRAPSSTAPARERGSLRLLCSDQQRLPVNPPCVSSVVIPRWLEGLQITTMSPHRARFITLLALAGATACTTDKKPSSDDTSVAAPV